MEVFLLFNRKRDRIQIIAEILGICRSPQTQSYIRRQTCISYAVLQSCIIHLLMRNWLLQVEVECGQKKLSITDKGVVFLDKWLELQKLAGLTSKRMQIVPPSEFQTAKVACR
jgi:predicted transcriptional regulator